MNLSEAEYDARALPELHRLVDALDALDEGALEAELAADILTIEFSDGAKYVINSHRAARQIWMAAIATAWHFDPGSDGVWRASRTGEELRPTLARLVRERTGVAVSL